MKFRLLLLVGFVALQGKLGLAQTHVQPYIEPAVQAHLLKSKENKNEKMSVVVLFQSPRWQPENSGVRREAASTILHLQKANRLYSQKIKDVFSRFAYDDVAIESLWIANGILAKLNANQIQLLTNMPFVRAIHWAQKPMHLKRQVAEPVLRVVSDYTYGLKNIGLPVFRQKYPHLTGAGVRVGVLDTGIVTTHPDLQGKLKVFKNFSPAKYETPGDDFGHGTHVSGTIAGGDTSNIQIGVAPEVGLIVGRIFDGNGDSTRELILRAMQWMADPDNDPSTDDFAQVVNSSWSDDEPFKDRDPESEPFCQIVKNWVSIGMIPVFSAGNTGPQTGTINLPAGCPEAFSVGATEQYDRSPHFSSTGPAIWKNLQLLKPEISAPGVAVKSADRYGGYIDMSGTSMAAPHVTGAFALLLQAFPNKSAQEIKQAMAAGAKDLGDVGQDAVFGWGRVDLVKTHEVLSAD